MKKEDGTYDNTENILKCVRLYNSTGEISHLWNCFEDLRHAVQSILWRRLKGNPTPTFTENVQMITEKWMLDIINRRKKGNPYHDTFSPISYAHFMVIRYLPSDDAAWNKRSEVEDDVIESFMHKDYSIGSEVDYTNSLDDLDYDVIL